MVFSEIVIVINIIFEVLILINREDILEKYKKLNLFEQCIN